MLAVLGMALFTGASAAPVEKIRNDKVVSLEYTLAPGDTAELSGRPAVTVYFNEGAIEFKPSTGSVQKGGVRRGDVVFLSDDAGEIRNAGSSPLKFVRTEFLTGGSDETWGRAGLAPNYKVLVENQYTRTYDIRIPAGEREPQHTHDARVVVCVSGAQLKHVMPDGREEPSTLETGEIAWRPASTHIGQNLGKTDLWVIAIEPK
jgi:quercetin dioxygenase-like cupin family protein